MGVVDLSDDLGALALDLSESVTKVILIDDLDALALDLSESVTKVILIANGIVYTVDMLDTELMIFLQHRAVQVANVA